MLALLPWLHLLTACPVAGTDDTARDTASPALRDPQWCAPTLAYRLPLEVSGPPTTPLIAHIDFADALGSADFDASSLRVYAVDGGRCVALPVQFLDGFRGILDKAASDDALGDDAGAVVVLRDGLQQPTGLALFFDDAASAGTDDPVVGTPLEATVTRMDSGVAEASFDLTRGGLLRELRLEGSPVLASMSEAWRGNGVNTGTSDNDWTLTAQSGPGALELLADGPVVAGLRTTGERSDALGGYTYTHEYWMFAGRPEVYGKVHQRSTVPTWVQHPGDFTRGLRPWQVRHDELDRQGIVERHLAADRAWVHDGTWGVAHGAVRAPSFPIEVLNDDGVPREIGFAANDYLPEGLGSPYRLPAGVTYFDHAVYVALPFRAETAIGRELDDVLDRPSVVVGELERR